MEIITLLAIWLTTWIITSISWWAWIFCTPSLIALWFSPIHSLILNKISDLSSSTWSISNYIKSWNVDFKLWLKLIPLSILWYYLWANIPKFFNENELNILIIIWLSIAIVLTLNPLKLNKVKKNYKILWFFWIIFSWIWWWAIWAVWATISMLILVYIFWKNFINARATEIFFSYPWYIISSIVLYMISPIEINNMIIMSISSLIWWYIWSKISIKKWSIFIKKIIIFISIIAMFKIIFDLF